MLFRISIVAWLAITFLLGLEFYALNFNPAISLVRVAQSKYGLLKGMSLSPEPGRPISMFLGYAGLGIMLLMNVYSMRKRIVFLGKILPEIKRMLDFHIFCGLLGPTLILFHSNFKVRGLVAISFWSMLVSAGSGVLGRYFYTQIARSESDLRSESEKLKADISGYLGRKRPGLNIAEVFGSYMTRAGLRLTDGGLESVSAMNALINTAVGDLRFVWMKPQMGVPEPAHVALVQYVSLIRREGFIGQFRKLMGYWHTFHLPFAFFMYVAAIFHVAAALLLGVANR